MEYEKYKGKALENEYINVVKKIHNEIKYHLIKNMSNFNNKSKKSVVDIGCGRGHELELLASLGYTSYIGIDPSEDSVQSAIRKVKFLRHKYNITMSIIRGVGDKIWSDGSAGLTNDAKMSMIRCFGNERKYDVVHMFWCIHYCMNEKNDFINLFINIDRVLKKDGFIIISSMNGVKIDKLMKQNNGKFNNNSMFEITSYYDHEKIELPIFGNIIGVRMAGAYGLNNEIKESVVFTEFLVEFFLNNGFNLVLNKDMLTYGKENNIITTQYNESQEKITELYDLIVLCKK